MAKACSRSCTAPQKKCDLYGDYTITGKRRIIFMGCTIFDNQINVISNKQSLNFFETTLDDKGYTYRHAYFNELNRLFILLSLPTEECPIYCTSNHVSILFCEGEADVFTGGRNISCVAGNVLIFRESCSFVATPKKGTALYMVCYKKEFFDNIFFSKISNYTVIYDFLILRNPKKEVLHFNCKHEAMLCHFSKTLMVELCSSDDQSNTTVHCATILFLSNLQRFHSSNIVSEEAAKSEEYLIGNILKYMVDNHTTATLTSAADHFNYHPAYFSSMFKKKAGCSFTKKMLEIRLEHARRLLISSNLSTQEIYERIGFQEKSYFHRCFKSVYGTTPIQYRKNFQPQST